MCSWVPGSELQMGEGALVNSLLEEAFSSG